MNIKKSLALELFKKLSHSEKNVALLHSAQNSNKSILAFNPVEIFSYKRNSKKEGMELAEKFIKKHKKHQIIGYFSYDLAYETHQVKQTAKDDLKLPDIYLLAYDNWLTIENNQITNSIKNKKFLQHIQEIKIRKAEVPKNVNGQNFRPTISEKNYKQAYEKIKKYIKEGDIYQINLTHRLEAKINTKQNSPRNIFLQVVEKNPVDYLAYIEGDDFEILSASPERFIKVVGEQIETCPIKGTRPRGKTAKEEQQLKKELIESKKEAAELNMITDLLRNDLGKVCKTGTVKVEGHRLLQECPTVLHTYSKITGELAVPATKGLISMLPGGSITGCPKKRAIEIIDELEPTTRSVYTGIIGHIEPNQNLDFNIAIRTIIKKKNKLYLQVGGGIVLDSNERAEFKETLDKARSFMNIIE